LKRAHGATKKDPEKGGGPGGGGKAAQKAIAEGVTWTGNWKGISQS